jgi:type IV secretion system protein VirB9
LNRISKSFIAGLATFGLAMTAVLTAQAATNIAADGSLRYAYGGRNEPTLTCRPLYVCDVALESGESVLNLAIGDSARWVIAAGQSGPGGATPHVFIKPTEAGLLTNVVITTNKRVYDIRLVSAVNAGPPRISFWYPEEAAAAAALQRAADKQRQDDQASKLPLLPPDKLDYGYRIDGAREIMPQRVYSDGVHTFIEFAALPTDLPVLYAVAKDGSNQIVNFRVRDAVFIVDGTQSGFDLVLNAGTGKHGRGELRTSIRHK